MTAPTSPRPTIALAAGGLLGVVLAGAGTLWLRAVAVLVDRSARSVLGGAAAGTAVFVGAVSFGSVLAQQDTSAPVALPGAVLALGAVAALAVGIGMLPLVWVAVTVSPWLWLVAGLVGGLMVALTSARVAVDRDGVRVSTLGLSWSRVPIERVASAEVGEVSALGDFGGWGWRIGRDGRRGFVTRSGEALVVHRRGEPDVVVTVDDARGAAAVVNTLAARA